MNWVKLIEVNDWNVISYRTADDRRVSFPPDRRTTMVQFPDGWIKKVQLEERTTEIDTHDMGHVYKTKQARVGFFYDLHGTRVWVDITSVKVAADFFTGDAR